MRRLPPTLRTCTTFSPPQPAGGKGVVQQPHTDGAAAAAVPAQSLRCTAETPTHHPATDQEIAADLLNSDPASHHRDHRSHRDAELTDRRIAPRSPIRPRTDRWAWCNAASLPTARCGCSGLHLRGDAGRAPLRDVRSIQLSIHTASPPESLRPHGRLHNLHRPRPNTAPPVSNLAEYQARRSPILTCYQRG